MKNIIVQVCKICDKKFADLRSHLRKHKITWQEYAEQYNQKPLSLIRIGKSEKDKSEKMINEYEIQSAIERREKFRKKQNK